MGKESIVLIVDDVKENIDALIEILQEQYKVRAALNGKMAISSMHKTKPDIVLLDISMTDMDGFEVLKYMKGNEELCNIPVIFVTAKSNTESEEKGLLLGAVDYVTKPYNADIVKIKVKNHLELKMYRDELEEIILQRTEEVRHSRDAIIVGMSLLAENRDQVTGKHIQRMKKYTEILTYKILDIYPEIISRDYADKTILFSPMHDIGKVGIHDNILQKKGKLTDEEFAEMKSHTTMGAELLRKTNQFLNESTDWLDISVEIAECHHEKYDGTGYPLGLSGENIPLSARIVSLADVYDALTSERPYKKKFSHEEAMDIILIGDGRTMPKDFDPKVLEAFRLTNKEFDKICNELSD